MKKIWFLFILAMSPLSSFAATVEIRRVSDNSLATAVTFGTISNTTLYSQCSHYILVQYTPGEPDLDTIQIMTNNRNWLGGASERAGLVRSPTPNQRVPVFWKAFATRQTGVSITAQNESTWKSLKDQNDPTFPSANPTNLDVPNFTSGTTYIYFGAKINSNTATSPYLGTIRVRDVTAPNDPPVPGGSEVSFGEDGFGTFQTLFRPAQDQQMSILYNLSSPSNVTIDLHDRRGNKMKQLLSEDKPAGQNECLWDGTDDNGTPVASGTYMVMMKLSGKIFKKKIVVIK